MPRREIKTYYATKGNKERSPNMYYVYNVKNPSEPYILPINRPAVFESEEKAKIMCDLANLLSDTETYAIGIQKANINEVNYDGN